MGSAWVLLFQRAVVLEIRSFAVPFALVLSILVSGFLSACGSTDVKGGGTTTIQPTEVTLLPQDYQAASVTASLLLTRKRATNARLAQIVDQASYEVYLNELLNSQDFVDVMIVYHNDLLGGLGKGLPATDPANDAAILGAYVATTPGVPYSDIITGNYCVQSVNGVLSQGPCRAVTGLTPPPQLSGVLTQPRLLQADFAAQWIRNANRNSERFVCVDYPDSQDAGRPLNELSPRYGGTLLGFPQQMVSSGPQCIDCHGSLSNRSIVFRNFIPTGIAGQVPGSYNPARTLNDVEVNFLYVAGNPAPQPNGSTHSAANSTYKGAPIDQVWDFGREMAKDSRFDECAARRAYNWVFAKPLPRGPVAADTLQFLVGKFSASNRSFKTLIFSIMADKDIYLSRFHNESGGTTP